MMPRSTDRADATIDTAACRPHDTANEAVGSGLTKGSGDPVGELPMAVMQGMSILQLRVKRRVDRTEQTTPVPLNHLPSAIAAFNVEQIAREFSGKCVKLELSR